ncbi:MAG: succinyl-diaminopimelate desuccinylase [Symploca sp. SIO2G7]|nr:succinyl-diaminopimelate desuccinylase [Symploca sp. SIO2G7]
MTSLKTPVFDPLKVTQALIRCPSVTPDRGGGLDVVQRHLEHLGFTCHRILFHNQPGSYEVDNLYARLGTDAPNLAFAGHTDVVPEGSRERWGDIDPYKGEIRDGILWGRGTVDMKAGIGCFIAAVSSWLAKHKDSFKGSLSFIITGDEEHEAINGTKPVMQWLGQRGEKIDACVVGEPTNPVEMGDCIHIGRRGSINTFITVKGKQGHVAYQQNVLNPVPAAVAMVSALQTLSLDRGNRWFKPSNLEMTQFETANCAENVIPAEVKLRFNIRFNNEQTGEGLQQLIRQTVAPIAREYGTEYDIRFRVSGEAFCTNPRDSFVALVQDAVEEISNRRPRLSTDGGITDARYLVPHCVTVEYGPLDNTMHQIGEHIPVAHIYELHRVYERIISKFFSPVG